MLTARLWRTHTHTQTCESRAVFYGSRIRKYWLIDWCLTSVTEESNNKINYLGKIHVHMLKGTISIHTSVLEQNSKTTAVDAIHWLYWYHNIQYWPNKTRRRDTSLIPAPAHWISPDVVRDFWHKGFSTFKKLTTKWCPLNQCPADGTENTRSSRDFVKILFPFTPIGQLNFSSGRCTNRASMYSQFPAPYIYD